MEEEKGAVFVVEASGVGQSATPSIVPIWDVLQAPSVGTFVAREVIDKVEMEEVLKCSNLKPDTVNRFKRLKEGHSNITVTYKQRDFSEYAGEKYEGNRLLGRSYAKNPSTQGTGSHKCGVWTGCSTLIPTHRSGTYRRGLHL